jgi:hypothetical protein
MKLTILLVVFIGSLLVVVSGCTPPEGTLEHNTSLTTKVDCKLYCQEQFNKFNCSDYIYEYTDCKCDCFVKGCQS